MRTLFLGLLLIPLTVYGQEIELKGQVSIHNSLYNTGEIEYVPNAYVSAPFTNPDDTDDEGRFSLEFVGIDGGTQVDLTVEKAGLEVVNAYELQRVLIGRKLSLGVYLAKKGDLALAQTELYEISREALFASRDSVIARLEGDYETVITELEEQLGQKIGNIYEAKDLLNRKIEFLEKQLPEAAQKLAIVNLDFASEVYQRAFEQFKKGKIEEAIDILDDSLLKDSVEEAFTHLAEGERLESIGEGLQNKGRLLIEQSLDSYRLKVESYNLLFQYGQSAGLQEEVIQILENIKDLDEISLANEYTVLARIYRYQGFYQKAFEMQSYAVSILEGTLEPADALLADSYNRQGIILRNLGRYQEALEVQEKVLVIDDANLGEFHPDRAITYNNLSVIYRELGLFDKALEAQKKAISIRELVLDSSDVKLANSYSNLATIYLNLGRYDEALTEQEKALVIDEKALDSKDPLLATSYNTMAQIYQSLGRYDEALVFQNKAIDIYTSTLGADHPRLATAFNNLATLYRDIGRFEEALSAQQRTLDIDMKTLEKDHPYVAVSYHSLSLIYRDLGQYEKALLAQQEYARGKLPLAILPKMRQ